MGESCRVGALASGAFLVVFGVLGGFLRQDRSPARVAAPPEVGRSADQVAAGGDPAWREVRRRTPEERQRARREAVFRRFDAATPARTRRLGLQRVIVHPFPAGLPAERGEDGPPWHLVLRADGTVSPLPRWTAAKPGGPAWLPPQSARASWHLAVPYAGRFEPARRATWIDLRAWFGKRMRIPAKGWQFAAELEGGPAWPEGLSPEFFRALEQER